MVNSRAQPVMSNSGVEDGFDSGDQTISQLIFGLKSAFRDAQFASVESLLGSRENDLRRELETVANKSKVIFEVEAILLSREILVKKEIEHKRQKNESTKQKYESESLEDAAKLEKGRNEILGLREENLRLAKEVEQARDSIAALNSEANCVESAKKKAEMEVEVLKKRFQKLDEGISKLEKDVEMSSQANEVFVKDEPTLLNEDEDVKPVVANIENPEAPLPSEIISIDRGDESERIAPRTKDMAHRCIKRKQSQAPILDKKQKPSPMLVDIKAEGNHDRAKDFNCDHRPWMQKALVAKQNPSPMLVDSRPWMQKALVAKQNPSPLLVDSRPWMQKALVAKQNPSPVLVDSRPWMQKALVAKQNPSPVLVDSRPWMQKTPAVKKY